MSLTQPTEIDEMARGYRLVVCLENQDVFVQWIHKLLVGQDNALRIFGLGSEGE